MCAREHVNDALDCQRRCISERHRLTWGDGAAAVRVGHQLHRPVRLLDSGVVRALQAAQERALLHHGQVIIVYLCVTMVRYSLSPLTAGSDHYVLTTTSET